MYTIGLVHVSLWNGGALVATGMRLAWPVLGFCMVVELSMRCAPRLLIASTPGLKQARSEDSCAAVAEHFAYLPLPVAH